MYNHRTTVKPLIIRLAAFNEQIFNAIYDCHCKDNANMHYEYLEKNFFRLMNKAIHDKSITPILFTAFCDGYDSNLQKLYNKNIEE